MELKRVNNGIQTLATALLAVLLIGYEVAVTAYLITAGDLGAVFNPLGFFAGVFVFFALIATLTTCFMVWALTMRSRRFRLLADRDPAVVSTCSPAGLHKLSVCRWANCRVHSNCVLHSPASVSRRSIRHSAPHASSARD